MENEVSTVLWGKDFRTIATRQFLSTGTMHSYDVTLHVCSSEECAIAYRTTMWTAALMWRISEANAAIGFIYRVFWYDIIFRINKFRYVVTY